MTDTQRVTAAYERLRLLAVALRRAQKNYFKTRDATDLRIARDYERRMDEELDRPGPLDPPPPVQDALDFGGSAP